MAVYDHFYRAFDRKFWLNFKNILRANYLLIGQKWVLFLQGG